MRFPEWLYRLLPGDQGSQQLGALWRESSSSALSVVVSSDVYVVPNDKVLVLTNASLRFVGGGAQTNFRQRIMADPPSGTTRYTIFEGLTSANVVATNWQGEVLIPGGWKVKVEGGYSAAAIANEVNGEIFGYLIPRGTFVFG